MPDLQLTYDAEVWQAVDRAGTDRAAILSPAQEDGRSARLVLLAEPAEPPIWLDLTAFPMQATSVVAAAEELLGGDSGDVEDITLPGGLAAGRRVRFVPAGSLVPDLPQGNVMVAELYLARQLRAADGDWLLLATVVTQRINELADIAENVEDVVAMATVI